MAWTQTDLDALESAIADGKGARVIQFSDGQRVEFHSLPEMLELRAQMTRAVNTSTVQRHRYASVSKGT